jgi:hypothetical protein
MISTNELEWYAGFAIGTDLKASSTGIHDAASLFAANIPNTFDCGAILAFAGSRATAARFKFCCSIETLIVSGQARNWARVQTRRAERCASLGRTLTVVLCPGFARRVRRGWRGWRRGGLTMVERRIPSPALGTLRWRWVSRWRIARNAATLFIAPIMTGRRA